jgi:RNA polymerase sigma-70 factor (ECF subfamily)
MGKNRTNAEWIRDLTVRGPAQTQALDELREYLRRAALFTFQRYSGDLADRSPADVDALAEDCAQEALIALLASLPSFRGDSRFTTWAYKFAVNISLTAARRERWKNRSLDQMLERFEAADWPSNTNGAAADPDLPVLRREIWNVIYEVIQEELSHRQRQVVFLMVVEGAPMDVVVERLGTNRNAIYKLLHDARLKIKRALQQRGFRVHEVFGLFDQEG